HIETDQANGSDNHASTDWSNRPVEGHIEDNCIHADTDGALSSDLPAVVCVFQNVVSERWYIFYYKIPKLTLQQMIVHNRSPSTDVDSTGVLHKDAHQARVDRQTERRTS